MIFESYAIIIIDGILWLFKLEIRCFHDVILLGNQKTDNNIIVI